MHDGGSKKPWFWQVGFSFGRSYQKVSVSGTDDVLSLVTRTNCGQPGVWLFRVDDVKVMDEKRCESKGRMIKMLIFFIFFYVVYSDKYVLFIYYYYSTYYIPN